MLYRTIEQADFRVVFPHEHMPKLMGQSHDADRAHGIDEQRMRAIEAVDIPQPVECIRPPRRLHRAAGFDRHLIKRKFPRIVRDASFAHQAAEIAVGREVIEAMIVHADVRHMRGHQLARALAAEFEQTSIVGHIERENRTAILKTLRPLGPTLARVLSLDRKDRRAA